MSKKNKISKYISIPFLAIIILIIPLSFIKFSANKNLVNVNNTSKTNSKDSVDNSYMDKGLNNYQNRFENKKLTSENIGVPVLYYHSVETNSNNEVTITPEILEKQLNYINDNGYVTITIKELYDHLKNNQLIPEKSIVITFDDGYMNNYTEAFPILKKLNMKATIFCVGNSLDGSYYLSKNAIKEMSCYGIDIESHTVNHMHLDTLSYKNQIEELKKSKEILENITGKEVLSIAYPFGDYNEDTIKAVKEAGYKLAFTTNLGLTDRNDNIFELDRIYISSYYDMNTFKNLLENTTK